MAQLYAFEKYPVQGDEYRHLYKNWQTPTQRIDFFFLVKRHHFLRHTLAIITVQLFQSGQLRRNGTHAAHGAIAGSGKFEKYRLNQNGKQDNGNAPVAY